MPVHALNHDPSQRAPEEPTLVDFVRFLRRNARLILGGMLVGAIAAVAVWILATPMYRANTKLALASAINGAGGSFSGSGTLQALGLFQTAQQGEADRIFAALESKVFLDKFIAQRNLAPLLTDAIDPARQLRGTINILDPGEPVIELTVSWQDPAIAADVANWLVEDLNAFLREAQLTQTRGMLGYLTKTLVDTSDMDLRATVLNLAADQMRIEMLVTAREQFALAVIDPAYPPLHPSFPRPLLLIVGGLLVGTMTGLLLAALTALWRRVKAEERERELT